MSRVYWHSPSGAAELRGSERAYAGSLISDLTLAIIQPDSFETPKRLRRLLGNHYLAADTQDDRFFAKSWATAFAVSGDGLIVLDGKPVDVWQMQLNTAMALGGDALRLLTRLHAQCEVHAYIEGRNRNWIAGIIDSGRESSVLRENQGWEAVSAFLRERDDEPVVWSYSVCDQFPNPDASDWMPEWPTGVARDWSKLTESQQRDREQRQEAWYELDRPEQWRRSMQWLRTDRWMEMQPENWGAYHFGNRFTAFDFVARLNRIVVR